MSGAARNRSGATGQRQGRDLPGVLGAWLLLVLAAGCSSDSASALDRGGERVDQGRADGSRQTDAAQPDRGSQEAAAGDGAVADSRLASSESAAPEELLAFPGALGFGRETPGGRGGRVIHVTTTADSGAGSLREACAAAGPRIIVFDTGGTITVSRDIPVNQPFVTIAGQTAPGGGICIKGGSLSIATHDVVVRGLRTRPGDAAGGTSPDNRDAMKIDNVNGDTYNVVVDSCSFSWGVDELLSVWHVEARDITVSRCILSEALHDSIHPKGAHGYGPVVGPRITNVAFIGNLLAHNVARNPRIQSSVVVANNLVYNRMNRDVDIGSGTAPQLVSVVGNWFERGPSTSSYNYNVAIRDDTPAGSQIFVDDNVRVGYTGDIHPASSFIVAQAPLWPAGYVARAGSTVRSWVLDNAGARAPALDPIDARVVSEVLSGTGSVINTPSSADRNYVYATGSAPLDSDRDGMPDSWESATGSNPAVADDAGDLDGDGYTNIEEYLNSLLP